jgi:hypothetical protein
MVEEKKNVNVFSLYTRERKISLEDDKGQKTEILLVKMTQRERAKAFDIYNETKIKEEKRLRENEESNKIQSRKVDAATKGELVAGIIDFERMQKESFANVFPFENETTLTKEEKEAKKKELLQNWEKERRAILENEKDEELRKTVLENSIELLSIIEAGRAFDFASLSFMCRDVNTKEKIFQDYTQVEDVHDRRVLDWLLEELGKFRKEEFIEEKAREEAQSPDFTKSGELPKP